MNRTMLKRLSALMLALALVMSNTVMPAFATGGETEATPCSHNFENGVCTLCEEPHDCSFETETARTEATCETAGSVTKACSCGATDTQEIGATGHSYTDGICSVCEAKKPCSLAADCDAPEHVEECLSQCTGEAECANKTHKEDCLSQCTGAVNCENKAHKEDCLSQADCTCVRLCSETMACPVCEGNGECKGDEAAERIAAVQTLIDALPTTYNFSEAADVKVQYDACTEEISKLTDLERAELNMTNYDAAAQPTVIDDSAASIGNDKFVTLNEAFEKAPNNSTIIVNKNLTLENPIEVPAGKTITLNLNGKVVDHTKACTGSYQMINNNGNLTITGNGTLRFTDTGNGDPNFGWGSYTIRNNGTLVVENGTIEHLGNQTPGTHCIQAIFQYSGSTTIKGGTIRTPNYRSLRLWHGSMTIEGGNMEGQLWVQTQKGDPATLTIKNGTFAPAGGDGSSVYVTNDENTVTLTIKNGTFNGKLGAADFGTLKKSITGGTYKNKDGTVFDVSAYLTPNYQQDATSGAVAKVEAKDIETETTDTKLTVSESVTAPGISGNAAVSSTDTKKDVEAAVTPQKIEAALAEITDAAGAVSVEVSMKITVEKQETNDGNTVLTFDVTPHVQPVDKDGDPVGQGAPVSEVETAITFRLPMPDGTEGKLAKVSHKHGDAPAVTLGSFEIQEEDGSCFLPLSSSQFSEYNAEITSDDTTDAVAKLESTGGSFTSLQDAINAAASGDTITLLKDIEGLTEIITIDKGITINGAQNGTTVSSSASRVFLITKGANGKTVTMNNVNVVSNAVRVGTNDIRGIAIDSVETNGITLTLTNCSVDFTHDSASDWSYGVNIATSTNDVLNITGGSYEGANVINVWGTGHKINISGATLTSLYAPNDMYTGCCINMDGTGTSEVNVQNTTFAGNHAVAIDQKTGNGSTITETNNTDNSKFYVAKIGSSYYYTLKEAAAAAQSGDEILLINPVELNETVEIPSGVTLDQDDETIALTKTGKLKAAEGLTVTTEVADHKVEYKNGTYQVIAKDYVAQVGTTKYESLQEAVNEATGKTVQLLKNVELTTALSVSNTVTLEGGSCTLSIDGETDMITVTTGGSLTIKSGTYDGKLNANGGAIVIQGGTFNQALSGAVTIPGTVPGATSGSTVANPAQFKLAPDSGMIAANYKAVKSGNWYVIRENDHLLVSTGGEYAKRYYAANETFEDVVDSEAYSSIKLTRNENLANAVTLTKTTTIEYNGYKITGTGALVQGTAGNSLYLKGIGDVVDLRLGAGDAATFNANGDVAITVAEDYSGSTGLGYGEIGVTITSTTETRSYTYSIGKDTVLIVKANGSIDSMSTKIENNKGQVNILRATNSTKPLYYMSYIGDGVSATQYQYFVTGTSKVLVFESNGFFDGLSYVSVDDKVLTQDTHYTAKRGSTIVTLKNAYLKTLSLGKHTLTMHFNDGQTAEGNFYVVNSAKPAWTPQTGDTIMTAVGIMAAAAIGLAVLIYLGKKKKK